MAEAEYRDGDEPALPEEEENEEETAVVDAEDEDGVEKEKPIPVSTFKPQPPLPAENYGSGVNKKIFFVCNERT